MDLRVNVLVDRIQFITRRRQNSIRMDIWILNYLYCHIWFWLLRWLDYLVLRFTILKQCWRRFNSDNILKDQQYFTCRWLRMKKKYYVYNFKNIFFLKYSQNYFFPLFLLMLNMYINTNSIGCDIYWFEEWSLRLRFPK